MITKPQPQVWMKLRFLFSVSSSFLNPIPTTPIAKTRVWSAVAAISTITASTNEISAAKSRVWTQISRTAATTALVNGNTDEKLVEEGRDDHLINNSTDVLRKWGCSDSEIANMFVLRPSLRRADPDLLQSKFNLLSLLGLSSSDLVEIVRRRPQIFSYRLNRDFDERIKFFLELFGSKELLHKAIVRNPSLLIYDLNGKIKRAVELYEGMGVPREDFSLMVMSKPGMIRRTSFNHEKLEYVRRTRVSQKSKMYKYVVVYMGILCLETIRDKVQNLEKFGFSENEVLELFGRTPCVLTLSTDKIQRNMTYVLATMKLPARTALDNPFLLIASLDTVLKPRYLLAVKIEEMGLAPQIKGPKLITALNMKEDRFLRAFITCHPEPISKELMEYYRHIKGLERLAILSKKSHGRFPY